jgi:23S rRNA (guanosine2251-2'-O)-methyltransferase
LRTCEGLGIQEVLFTGYTPHPERPLDSRMPHEVAKISRQIHKTALGAEQSQKWAYHENVDTVIGNYKHEGYVIAGLEQAPESVSLTAYEPPEKMVIILGREVEGLEPEIVAQCDVVLEIPMYGSKESYNVVQAAAMALYHCRFA